jgi:NAD(P)H-hydrate epimerase
VTAGPDAIPAPGALALYRAAGARALDRAAIEGHGIPGIELMERAGSAAFGALRRRWPAARRVMVLSGPGNNGGDGFVVARLASEAGLSPTLYLLGDPARVRGDAATALSRWRAAGGEVPSAASLDGAGLAAVRPDVVVDGLFGTGLARPLDGDAARLVRLLNAGRDAEGGARLALDIPSGLCADTGAVLGEAVRADLTVSFIGLKQGLFTGRARECCGEVLLAGLDLPRAVYAGVPVDAWRLTATGLGDVLGRRPRAAHKGRFGHVLVVGGDSGYAGAARLCAEAAARAGAGLVSVATRAAHVAALVGPRPELMVRGVEDAAALEPLLEAASVVAVGPGLGRGTWGTALLERVLASDRPRVLDADALNVVAARDALRGRLAQAPCVVTPHPGEAGRLLASSAAMVEADRFAAVGELGRSLGCTVLLKGAGTLVQSPGGLPLVLDGGNPGMASGGMGDVLTGVLAGLLAQGLPPMRAASVAGLVHAAAADAAAQEGGERGLLAGDLLTHLRRLVNPP